MKDKKTLDANYRCAYYYNTDNEEPKFAGTIEVRTNSKDDYELLKRIINHQVEIAQTECKDGLKYTE